jgi:hypothetical protein
VGRVKPALPILDSDVQTQTGETTSMKYLSSILAILVLSIAAFSQDYPVGPNVGKATTPYATTNFSATFDGPVTAMLPTRNGENTSTDYKYVSQNGKVAEAVTVRFIDHDIAVDYTSSDFYANDDRTGGTVDTANTSHDSWNGAPFTYTYRTFTLDGVILTKRTRYIIVNAREAIFIQQITAVGYEDRPEWLDFEYSLRIK